MKTIYSKYDRMRKTHGLRLSKLDFDDIFQRTVIAMHKHKDKIQNEDAFLYDTVRREVAAFKMQKHQKKTSYYDVMIEYGSYENTSNDALTKDIINAIESLPNKTRDRIKEYLLDEKTILEIANDNELNYDTTKATIRRGLEILRGRLKKWMKN